MEMLLKLPRDSNLIAKCKSDLQKQMGILHADKKFRNVIIVPDVDAM
jgi:primosomal protein N' (replication factor Y)